MNLNATVFPYKMFYIIGAGDGGNANFLNTAFSTSDQKGSLKMEYVNCFS